MTLLLVSVGILAGVIFMLFAFVIFFGPPYVPTLARQTEVALDLLDLQPGQLMLELGAGDGKVALAAARRGLRVVGIELNPLLVLVARARCWRYRRQVTIRWGSYWRVAWPPKADAIFTFMLQRQMGELDRRIAAWRTHPVRLASFAFHVPGKTPVQEREGVFLYEY